MLQACRCRACTVRATKHTLERKNIAYLTLFADFCLNVSYILFLLPNRVLSLGEASSGYLITTAENELGVVIAKSEMSGMKMVPVSWTEMQCPKTYNKENRKIAKVIPEDLNESI